MPSSLSRRFMLLATLVLVAIGGYAVSSLTPLSRRAVLVDSSTPLSPAANGPKTEAEWKAILTPEQYHVLREKGTETPFSSPLDFETRPGTYVSADCGVPLFRSEQKYDSGTGWPSFWAPISSSSLTLVSDRSFPFQPRTEVVTTKCGGHLGHVFDDGPPPTGKRYCMNGTALLFIPDTVTSTEK